MYMLKQLHTIFPKLAYVIPNGCGLIIHVQGTIIHNTNSPNSISYCKPLYNSILRKLGYILFSTLIYLLGGTLSSPAGLKPTILGLPD